MDWKNRKKFSVLKMIAIELATTSSLNLEKDTCHWHSKCYETSLKFNISLREIYLQSSSIRVTEKYDENTLMKILQVFGTL